MVSDTSMIGLDRPSIVYRLRGIVSMEFEVRGPSHDLHSGMYGGVVHNPAQALVEILAAMHDEDGHVAVPGFYDKVRELSAVERAEIAQNSVHAGTADRRNRRAASPGANRIIRCTSALGMRPTFEINGLVGGWTGEGGKTVLPAKAVAKVSCRLVPDQDPLEIFELIQRYLAQITPPTVTSSVRLLHKGLWALVDTALALYAGGGARV